MITAYLDGGGRLVITGHDIAWALGSSDSPSYSLPARHGCISGVWIDGIAYEDARGERYQAPNMNAHAERFVRSIRSECLDRMVLVGRGSLETAIAEYVAHYHGERSHQGLGNEIPSGAMVQRVGRIEASERLGGLLNYYHRRVA